MCGILGYIGENLNIQRFIHAVDTLDHRGPDGKNFVSFDNTVFLGHTRLSIIDLSARGNQPITNENKDAWIVFNGEIYNFIELRNGLKKKGHKFLSETDTEVILHLYEEMGERCINELNGMFAFAIYDKRKCKIFIARDRLGIKPIYYSLFKNCFIFASEIKAIIALNIIPKAINWQGIYDYFSFFYVPCPQTAFEHIFQVPPAHYLIFDIKKRQVGLGKYWDPTVEIVNKNREEVRIEDCESKIKFLLEDSVKRQLISDVPLGVFLSGGIDSSILAAIAARNVSKKLKTFTIVFEGEGIKANDDKAYASEMSRVLNTEHYEIKVDLLKPKEILELIRCFDQPFGNPTFYISYLLSKATREYVKVALSGSGGDELFGGYPRYGILSYARALELLPKSFADLLDNLFSLLPENPNRPFIRRAKSFIKGMGQRFPEQYLRWIYYFSDEDKRNLLKPLFDENILFNNSVNLVDKYLKQSKVKSLLNRVEYLDLKTFLLDNVLEYTDKTSMAVGLEVRVPYLDHRIVELSMKIPAKYKIHGRNSKFILKDTFKTVLPQVISNAPKRGFTPPISVWMDKYFDFYFEDILTPEYMKKQGVLDWAYIQKLRMAHKKKNRDNSRGLFGIIMFDIWYRNNFN